MAGKLFELGSQTPYRHERVWRVEETAGPDRLCIGGGTEPVTVLAALSAALAEPHYVLAVVQVPRCGETGRFESDLMTGREVAGFLDEFHDLFADDARADVWVGAADSTGLLILDEHDLIYAYGPLEEFVEILDAHEYTEGLPDIPAPHEHRFNPELDPLEVRLREWPNWRRRLPLQDED